MIIEMIALGETLYCQLAYVVLSVYARNPINKAIQTVPNAAAPVSHIQEPAQSKRFSSFRPLFGLSFSGFCGCCCGCSDRSECDIDLEGVIGLNELASEENLYSSCRAICCQCIIFPIVGFFLEQRAEGVEGVIHWI